MADIIKLNTDKGSEPPVRIKQARSCRHLSILVNETDRIITCDHCGATIDPFDYLLEWGKGDRNVGIWRKRITARIKIMDKKLADLKREERNTRARLKGLEQK